MICKAVSLLNSCLAFLAICLLSAIANAQAVQTLTLDQAIQMGIAASTQLKLSQSRYDYAKSKYAQTYDVQYPSLKLSAAYSRLSDVPEFQVIFPGSSEPQTLFPVFLNSFQNRLSLNEVIFAGFRVKNAKESADRNLGASQYDFAKDKQEIKLNIINAYFNLYKMQQAVQIINVNLQLIDQRLKDVQSLMNNGMATYNDELRAELQQSNTQLSKIDANNILHEANFNFNILVGLPAEQPIAVDTNFLFSIRSVATHDVFISNALEKRPEVQALNLRNKAAIDNLKIAQNGYLPTISAGADLFYASPNARYIPPTDVFKATWDIGISLNWDITSVFTNKHVVAENKALLDQSNALQQQLHDAIRTEVYLDYLSYQEAIEKLHVLSKAVLTAEENLKVTESRYRNNVALVSDLTDAQNQQIQSEINLVVAKADAQIAYYRLQKSSGDF